MHIDRRATMVAAHATCNNCGYRYRHGDPMVVEVTCHAWYIHDFEFEPSHCPGCGCAITKLMSLDPARIEWVAIVDAPKRVASS